MGGHRVDPEFTAAKLALSEKAEEFDILENKLNDIISLEAYKMSASRLQFLNSEKTKLRSNIRIIKEALFECYESTLEDLRCADIEDLHFEKMNEAEILKETKIVQGPK